MPASTLVDLVKVSTTTVGTASVLQLGTASTGYRGVSALIDGNTYSYAVQQGANWEYGRGVFTSSTSRLTRVPIQSSAAGSPIALVAGAEIAIVLLAEDLDDRVGIPANITIGTVTSGSTPSVTISGVSPNFTLNFVLVPGATGPSNVLTPGTVTKIAAGGTPTVTITGTSPSQTVNFGLVTGDQGTAGPANTLAIGTVTKIAAGGTPTAAITGTSPSQTLNLGIVTGDTGNTGPANTLTVGTVTKIAAGGTPTVTITGTSPSQTVNFGLVTGDTGGGGSATTTRYFADSLFGNDTNDGLTQTTPKKSLAALATLAGTRTNITLMLARGSHWYGEYPNFANTAWSKIETYGQGTRPVVDGALNLFAANGWLQDSSWPNTWYQDIVLPNPTSGSGPGDANRWHIGLWDEERATVPTDISDTAARLNNSWAKRVLNGDPSPDPLTFNINRPQTTTIAYTSRSDFLLLVDTYPNTFTVFPTAGTGYEPNDGTPRTAFRVYFHPRDNTNPNTNGRIVRINEQQGLMTLGRGMDVHDVIYARDGGKDMVSGFQDLTNLPRPSGPADIFSGNFYNCAFWQAGCHGPVCAGMGGEDCDYIGHYMRDAYKSSGGAYHDFRSVGGVNKGRGMAWLRCTAQRFGYMFYAHGNGDGSDQQNRELYVDGGWARDGSAVAVGGSASQGYLIRNFSGFDIDSCGSTTYPSSTYENCKFIMRPTGTNSIGGGANYPALTYPSPNCGTARFINSLVVSTAPTLSLPVGPLATLTQPQFINLILEGSTIYGNIVAQTNAQYRQLNITMDRYSYLGVFNSNGGGDINSEFYPTGNVTAPGPDASGNFGAIIECLRTAPETIRAQQSGIAVGVETGKLRQSWQWAVQQSDIVYVAPTSAVSTGTTGWTDNGDGTATIPTSFNFGSPNISRSVKITLGNGATDYYGAVVNIPNSSSIVVTPLPTAPITTAKAISIGYFRPFPFRDAVTAYVSTDGTQLNVPSTQGLAVGQYFRVGSTVSSQPGYGIRKITAISGNVLTLDKACPWLERQDLFTYRAISTPTSGTGRTLPTVQISWGFPIQARILVQSTFVDPQIVITKAEGGADVVMQQIYNPQGQFNQGTSYFDLRFNSNGTTYAYDNADYEKGFWYQAVSLAAGDVMKMYCLVDASEYRLNFNTPPALGGYSPTNTSLLAVRGIGYRPAM